MTVFKWSQIEATAAVYQAKKQASAFKREVQQMGESDRVSRHRPKV
jgi:hypothetical protein